MFDFKDTQGQTQEQKNHPDDACGKRKGKKMFNHLADPANGKNNCNLFDDLQNVSLLRPVLVNVIYPLPTGLSCDNCGSSPG